MWERIRRLMLSSEKIEQHRHSRLADEFDKFVTVEGESLSFVYEWLTTLVNFMDRNEIRPLSILINTKFLNSLQPDRLHDGMHSSQQYDKANSKRKICKAENISEVNVSKFTLISGMISKGGPEQTNHVKLKTVINTTIDDQIDSSIIFDDPYVEINGGTDEHVKQTNMIQMFMISLVYDPFLKAGLGYQNPKHLKKAITEQPKIYDGERLQSTKLIIDSPDSEETLEDAKESRLKMKDKIIQLNYEKLNALYEIFVPQQEIPIEQTYFSTPSTSNVPSESSIEMSDLPLKKMLSENKLLQIFVKFDNSISDLQTKIDQTLLKDRSRALIFDDQDVLRQFYKTGVILMFISFRRCSNEIKQEITEEVQVTPTKKHVRYRASRLD
ncbi:hypothetical protein Tco_0726696 [Tanacetum coccineum]|uniref:Uncharacterized protein n=1 Tax=Tanacetum coccineum TaxID=301880 RepID=A0ABQ4YGY2_9ASTR